MNFTLGIKVSTKKQIDKYITTCTTTFKMFDHDVIISKNKANLWHFSAKRNDKKYLVYCAPNLSKVKSIIKIALKKVPADSKLVVICNTFTNEEKQLAEESNYALVDIHTLQKYGTEMIEARSNDETSLAA